MAFVVLHEAFHRGLRKMFPNEGAALIRQMWRSNQALKVKTAEYQHRFSGMTRDEAIEEALADMAGAGKASSLKGWGGLMAIIKAWAHKVARALGVELVFDDAMIETFVAAAAQRGLQRDPPVFNGEAVSRKYDSKEAGGEVKLSHEKRLFDATESRLVQGLAEAGLDGLGAERLVRGESAQPSVYTSDGTRPRPYGKHQASPRVVDAEETRLIARAKAEGFFWDDKKLLAVRSVLGPKTASGSEHDVYVVGKTQNILVIRNTIKDSYGFAHNSPAQYLQRLAHHNSVFPGLQVRVIGVSQNARVFPTRVGMNRTNAVSLP